jgi:hypothetical protein
VRLGRLHPPRRERSDRSVPDAPRGAARCSLSEVSGPFDEPGRGQQPPLSSLRRPSRRLRSTNARRRLIEILVARSSTGGRGGGRERYLPARGNPRYFMRGATAARSGKAGAIHHHARRRSGPLADLARRNCSTRWRDLHLAPPCSWWAPMTGLDPRPVNSCLRPCAMRVKSLGGRHVQKFTTRADAGPARRVVRRPAC